MQMRDMAGEAVLIAAGGRSILLQIADPAIGHGIAHHSDFASRPLDRLRGTLTYVYAVMFGTPEEAARARRRVDHAHASVSGLATEARPAYTAFTPELQLWVAATLYDSAMTMRELVYGPLDGATADALYREYAVLGTALQMPAELWPPNRAAFAAYWDRRVGELQTDAATRAVARQLLHPRTGPLWLRLMMPLGRFVTVGLLPCSVRELFDLPWTVGAQRRFDRLIRLTIRVYPRLPRRLRHWPKNHYLRAMR
ncbi:oxygenase MpaB family protein [Cryobacterium sp. M96]|uniref:oxygenase MpaB family protein n=1 Tax=Cryobacterium sp. M96 TaxID=2048295 RepID=UPI001E470942|nr:oxygenase MpaB family protein [Cryobacterium sp. M96]